MGSLTSGATAAASGPRCSQRDASETPAGIPGRLDTKRKQAPDTAIGRAKGDEKENCTAMEIDMQA